VGERGQGAFEISKVVILYRDPSTNELNHFLQRLVFPEDVAFQIGKNGSDRPKYFLMETHYDNPETISNRKFATGVQIFYTDKPRYER